MASAALRGDKTLAEIVQQYEIHPNQVTEWKRQLAAVSPASQPQTHTAAVGLLRIDQPNFSFIPRMNSASASVTALAAITGNDPISTP